MKTVAVVVLSLLALAYAACFTTLFLIYKVVLPHSNDGRDAPEGWDMDQDECTWHNITTGRVTDLTVSLPADGAGPSSAEVEEAIDVVDRHGVGFFENVLSEDTRRELREYLVEQNKLQQEEFFVLEGRNRHHLRLGVHDAPILTQAITEVVQHKLLRPAIERLVGAEAALVEFAAITALHGARSQDWHPDVSRGDDPSTVVPLYSIFIPLQATTREMGATGICPGTHVCMEGIEDRYDSCTEHGVRAATQGGTAAMMDGRTIHRGGAHTDADALERVMFYLSFAGPPDTEGGKVRLPSGATYALRWDMWGHTLSEIDALPSRPWSSLDSINGLRHNRGWTFQDKYFCKWANGDDVWLDMDLEEWTEATWAALKWLAIATAVVTFQLMLAAGGGEGKGAAAQPEATTGTLNKKKNQ